jgi:hypothetical protein
MTLPEKFSPILYLLGITWRRTSPSLFRISKGPTISLRLWAPSPSQKSEVHHFSDVYMHNGKVLPEYELSELVQGESADQLPIALEECCGLLHGATMYSNGGNQQRLLRGLTGEEWVVYNER